MSKGYPPIIGPDFIVFKVVYKFDKEPAIPILLELFQGKEKRRKFPMPFYILIILNMTVMKNTKEKGKKMKSVNQSYE